MKPLSRRKFVATTVKSAALLSALPLKAKASQAEIAVVRNASPAEMVRKVIEMMGGMERFVKKGQSVLLKPNMSWDRLPEQAANTNPEAVAEVVTLCKKAGAKRVRIVDRTCNHPRRCYMKSGIEKMAKAAGAEVRYVVESRFVDVDIPDGVLLKSWPVYKDVLDFDVFINMPIAKSHNVSGVTLGMKNIMGLIGGNRGDIHVDFDTKIVDLNTVIHPALTIVDAWRVLVKNGPSGGSLDDVVEKRMMIAGTDPVAVDAYAAVTLFDLDPQEITFLSNANARGLGQADLSLISIKEFDFSG